MRTDDLKIKSQLSTEHYREMEEKIEERNSSLAEETGNTKERYGPANLAKDKEQKDDNTKEKCQSQRTENSREDNIEERNSSVAEATVKDEERDGPANMPKDKEQKDDNTKEKFDDLKIKCHSQRTENSKEREEKIEERNSIVAEETVKAKAKDAPANVPNDKEKKDDNRKEKFEDKTNVLEQNQMDNYIENNNKVANETTKEKWPAEENPQIEKKKISNSDNKERNASKAVLPGQQENGKLPSTNLTSADFTKLPKIKIASQKYPCYIPRVKKVVIEQKIFVIF